MKLRAPKASISNVGIDGRNIIIINGVGDFTGVDTNKINQTLIKRGWKVVGGPEDTTPKTPEEQKEADETAARATSALDLLRKVDAMDVDQLKKELTDRQVAFDQGADRELLIRIVHEILVAEQRDEAAKSSPGQGEDANAGGNSPPPPPPPPSPAVPRRRTSGRSTFEQ